MTERTEYLTRAQVAEIFQVHPHTIWNWAERGTLKAVKTPTGRRRYRREDVDALLAEQAS